MKIDLLLKKIREEFPNLHWSKSEHLTCGWDHDVVILDRKWVFRFPKEKKQIPALKKEIALLRYLKPRISLAIPDYQLIAKDYSVVGYPIIPGKEFKASIYRNKVRTEDKKSIAKQLGQFLTQLHDTPLAIAKKYKGMEPTFIKTFPKLKQKTHKWLFPKFSASERTKVTAYFKEFDAAYKPNYRKVLIHYDLAYEHILISDDYRRLTGIIDFTDRTVGDPALDFDFLNIHASYGSKFLRMVYDAYELPKDLSFFYRAKLYLKNRCLWHMIDALSLKTIRGEPNRLNYAKEYKAFQKNF